MRTGYESYVRPGVEQAEGYARVAGRLRRAHAVGNALGSVLSIGDIANDARVRRAVAARLAARRRRRRGEEGRGVGTYLAIGAGIVAAAGVAYAVWQTFRADDELWVADDEPDALDERVDPPATESRSIRSDSSEGPACVPGGAFVMPGCRVRGCSRSLVPLSASTEFRVNLGIHLASGVNSPLVSTPVQTHAGNREELIPMMKSQLTQHSRRPARESSSRSRPASVRLVVTRSAPDSLRAHSA